MAHFVAIKAS